MLLYNTVTSLLLKPCSKWSHWCLPQNLSREVFYQIAAKISAATQRAIHSLGKQKILYQPVEFSFFYVTVAINQGTRTMRPAFRSFATGYSPSTWPTIALPNTLSSGAPPPLSKHSSNKGRVCCPVRRVNPARSQSQRGWCKLDVFKCACTVGHAVRMLRRSNCQN